MVTIRNWLSQSAAKQDPLAVKTKTARNREGAQISANSMFLDRETWTHIETDNYEHSTKEDESELHLHANR